MNKRLILFCAFEFAFAFPILADANCGKEPYLYYCDQNSSNQTAPPVNYLDGEYDMQLRISNKLFHDKVVIQGVPDSILLSENGNFEITGTVEVQNSFIAPLSGHATCFGQSTLRACQVNFEITAKENGQEFLVQYFGQLSARSYLDTLNFKIEPVLEGQAKLENGNPLGAFKAIRIKR